MLRSVRKSGHCAIETSVKMTVHKPSKCGIVNGAQAWYSVIGLRQEYVQLQQVYLDSRGKGNQHNNKNIKCHFSLYIMLKLRFFFIAYGQRLYNIFYI